MVNGGMYNREDDARLARKCDQLSRRYRLTGCIVFVRSLGLCYWSCLLNCSIQMLIHHFEFASCSSARVQISGRYLSAFYIDPCPLCCTPSQIYRAILMKE